MMKRAVVYTRVSTDEQTKGYSLGTQLERCQEYARSKGYQVAQCFQDSHTGTQLDRPGLNHLYRYVENEEADILIVYDIDRLSREVGNQAIIEMEMARHGVLIEYVLGNYANTPEGELMKVVKSGIAQYENRQRVERSRRGKAGRIQAGYVIVPSGRAPFGYTYISEPHKGWLVINESEAAVVRKIYEWLIIDRLSSYAIAKKLWEDNILTRGDYSDVVFKKNGRGEWSPTTVRRIISNPVYKGVWFYGKTRRTKVHGKVKQLKVPEDEWLSVSVPAIVDSNTWEEAQIRLKENKENALRNTRRSYLLRGMIHCTCGRRWTGRYKNPQKIAYYRCPTSETQHWLSKCESHFSYRQEVLENAIWNTVVSFLLDRDSLVMEIDRRREEEQEISHRYEERLAAIETALAEVDRKMEILLDQILIGDFTKAIIDRRKQELRMQREDLEDQKQQVLEQLNSITVTPENEQDILAMVDKITTQLDNATFEVKRHLLEMLKTRIDVIDRDQVKLRGVISYEGIVVNLSSA